MDGGPLDETAISIVVIFPVRLSSMVGEIGFEKSAPPKDGFFGWERKEAPPAKE